MRQEKDGPDGARPVARADPTGLHLAIVHNLVYVAGGHEVKTEMVARKALVRDGEVLAADEATICDEAQVQADAVARRVAADSVHREMALTGAMKVAWR